MPNIVSLHGRKRPTSMVPVAYAETSPIARSEVRDDLRQTAREALQEAVFALQITHAQANVVIEKIENPGSREQLRTQSARIGGLIDLAWSKLGDI